MSTTHTESNSEPRFAGCPWCNAVPQPHPDVLSAKAYMVLYHTAECFRSPQIGGYELIPLNKIDKWNSRVSANVVAPIVDAEKQARDLVDAFRFASPPVQSLRFLDWEPLVAAITKALRSVPVTPLSIRARTAAVEITENVSWGSANLKTIQQEIAAIVSKHFPPTVAPVEQSGPQYVTIDGERRQVIPCPDGREDCEVLHTAAAPLAARQDEAVKDSVETHLGRLPFSLIDEIHERRQTIYRGLDYRLSPDIAARLKTDLDYLMAFVVALRHCFSAPTESENER